MHYDKGKAMECHLHYMKLTHEQKRSSKVLLIQNNDIKETVALYTKCMGSNVEFLQLRYEFAKSRSEIENFRVYWVPDTKK